MPDVSFDNLLVISVIAVVAPLLAGAVPRLRLPAVVLEIVAGIVVGPTGFDWVRVDLPVQILALFGLAFLLFLAGLEIDLARLRGRPLAVAAGGYVISLSLGLAVGGGLHAVGWVQQPLLVGVALSATSLGLVVPVLKDAGHGASTVGQVAIAAATVADFAAIVVLSFFFSASGGGAGAKIVLLAAFATLIGITAVVVLWAGHSMRLGDVLLRLQDTTAEIRVRLAVALLVLFVALATRFGLESILGAFLAGAVVRLVDRDSASHPHLRSKLEAIGYGFVVPVFFVSSGIRLDLTGLLHSSTAIARVPVFLAALLLVRGGPALLSLRALGGQGTAAVALLQATSLPFLVTATQIGLVLGKISPLTAAAVVCAGLLSVLFFPPAALALLKGGQSTGGQDSVAPRGSSARSDLQARNATSS